ncbi:hypothetical protein [Brachybacterium hainanense]|uniref:Trimeric autotransporter adhesin YadA-like stalk domain-containing protein n=1 Tax=Brachybacterium hainanense TaxID=1541174 RepID=A0ABV6RCE6_9MICO
MPSFPQEVADNLRSLQRQINAIVAARPGPMSWGPDDGGARFEAADGRTVFGADHTGASVESRGTLTGLTPLLDSIRDKNDDQDDHLGRHDADVARIDAKNVQQDGRLTGAEGRLTSAEGRLGTAEGRLDSHDGTLASHGTRIGNAEGRLNGHDSTLSSHNTRINTAQTTANGAVSVNGTQATQISNLQSAMNDKASNSDVQAVQSAVNELASAINGLRGWLASNTPYSGSIHPDARYFLEHGQLPP